MAHIPPTSSFRWSLRSLAVLVVAFLAIAIVAAVALVSVTRQFAPSQQDATAIPTSQAASTPTVGPQPLIEYATESGQATQQGVVDAPLKITVRIPTLSDRQDGDLNTNVTVQLLDEVGQPAQYGGHQAEPFTMLPAFETGAWSYYGSVPSKPGAYHAHVVMSTERRSLDTPAPQANREYDFDLANPLFRAVAESGPPLASGYVFSEDSNLWLLSTNLTRQRRLTFFTPPDEYAGEPVWTPDGTQVTFAFTPKAPPSELPVSDIWAATLGNGASELVKHGTNETLRDPAWSSDGRYLYFTVEQSDPNVTTYNSMGVPEGSVRIDRLDTQSGVRSQWVSGGEMPGSGGPSGRMLYLEDATDTGTDPSQAQAPGQQLVSVNADGSDKKVLVDNKMFVAMDYPTVSPDGKWVAFAAIYLPRNGGEHNFDLLAWLGLNPQPASAHGLPWDMFVVSMQGGTPIKISAMSDDQPHPAWLSNKVFAYMGSYAMYKVDIDSSGKPLQAPQEIHQGVSHGGLTWHGP